MGPALEAVEAVFDSAVQLASLVVAGRLAQYAAAGCPGAHRARGCAGVRVCV